MNTLNINLNLLRALDALLTEQHVSKAGIKIGITQSAMSISLKQLRTIYQDELLVRSPSGKMHLTPLAKTLIYPVQQALSYAAETFVGHVPFDPTTAACTFHIGMSDYIAFVLLPPLMKKIANVAPHVRIVQHAINHLESLTPFEEEGVDIIIGDFAKAPSSLKTTSLFFDKGVIVADKNHPAFKKKMLSLKDFLTYPQIFVSLEGYPEENVIVEMLRREGHQIEISLMTPHTLIALQTLPGTTLMTNTVVRLAQSFLQQLGLATRPTPYKLRPYHARLYWHIERQNAPGHQWLRSMVKEIAKSV